MSLGNKTTSNQTASLGIFQGGNLHKNSNSLYRSRAISISHMTDHAIKKVVTELNCNVIYNVPSLSLEDKKTKSIKQYGVSRYI